MTDLNPLSQLEAEREIVRLSGRLSVVTTEVADAAMVAARADADYDLAHAKALLRQRNSDGTVPEKQAQALVECEEQFLHAKLSEAKAKALYESGRNLRAQLEALRSLNANVRYAVDHSSGRGA